MPRALPGTTTPKCTYCRVGPRDCYPDLTLAPDEVTRHDPDLPLGSVSQAERGADAG